MSSESLNKIDNLYETLSYTDEYSSSILVFTILILLFFLICSYLYIEILKQPIKEDWNNKRCSPMVIPFAGLINKPADESILDFTNKNFQYCVQNSVKKMSGYFLQPLTYVTSSLHEVASGQSKDADSSRKMFNSVRSDFSETTEDVYGRMLNIMAPIQQIIITFRDFMAKIQGVMTASIYTLLGSYLGLESLFGSVMQMSELILIALAVLIAIFWIFIFTWPIAASMTALYAVVAIPLAIIITWAQSHLPGPAMKCFDRSTIVKKADGTRVPIHEIRVGDFLQTDREGFTNKVSAVIKVETKGSAMYRLGNIIVSDSHKVYYNDKLIPVSEHPDAVPFSKEEMEDYERKESFLYCLNTTRKKILLSGSGSGFVFSDWDDLTYEVIQKNGYTPEQIHEWLDKGFIGTSVVKLNTGVEKKIRDVEVGDILEKGEKVYGIVEILGSDSYSADIKSLFHLLTDKGKFIVNNIPVSDYNSCIDEKIIF